MGIIIPSVTTEILRFIALLKSTHLYNGRDRILNQGTSDCRTHVLSTVTFTAGNSSSLKEVLGLEKTKTRLCLVGMCWVAPRRPARPVLAQPRDQRKSPETVTEKSVIYWIGL